MIRKSYCIGMSVRGALQWSDRDARRALKWCFRNGGQPFANVSELRDALMDELVQGMK